MKARAGVAVVVVWAGLWACSAGQEAADGPAVKDSAGVTVVTNPASLVAAAPTWTVAAEPLVVAGDEDGDPDAALSKIVDVLPLDDGRVAVATAQPPHVVLFGPDGGLEGVLGREGEGPGEFQGLSTMVDLSGDSLAVWDAQARRISIFTLDGALGREVNLSDAAISTFEGWSRLLGTPSGAMVLFTLHNVDREAREPARYRAEGTSPVLDRAGGKTGEIGPLPGDEIFLGPGRGLVPYGGRSFATTVGDALWFADSGNAELRRYALDGRLTMRVRWPARAEPVTPEMRRSWIDDVVAGAPEAARPRLREMAEQIPMAEETPVLTDLVPSDEGQVWVGDYPGEPATHGREQPERHWLVFGADGALVARAVTPAGFTPRAVRGDRVWGVYKDALGVETVRAYGLAAVTR